MDWSKLFLTVVTDWGLSIDNALLISTAVAAAPQGKRLVVLLLGMSVAIPLRIALTGFFGGALSFVPGLEILGGLVVIWLTVKFAKGLLGHETEELQVIAWLKNRFEGFMSSSRVSHASVAPAVIIVADDALNSLDNVLAIAGASGGDFTVIALGLLMSMSSIAVFAYFFSEVLRKYAKIAWLAVGALALTALNMFYTGTVELLALL